MRRIIIITWVSWSWKTTLQEELLRRWWVRPLNFTTRNPRSDLEQDEYIFLTKEQYLYKFWMWDFLENTNYWWNMYAVSKYLPEEWNICIVLDPVGRAMASEYFIRNNIEFETIYLDINEKIQEERFLKRWDSIEEVNKRKKDFNWFSPTNNCTILDWRTDVDILANLIWN